MDKLRELCWTHLTVKRFLSRMQPHVRFQVACRAKSETEKNDVLLNLSQYYLLDLFKGSLHL